MSSIGGSKGVGNRILNEVSNKLSNVLDRLTSGKRINKASDDAAGLAIAKSLEAAVATLQTAGRNINDGVSAIAIADGALESAASIGARLGELATQASNGTLSDTQRAALNTEYQALVQEAQRIGATTEFNDQNLLSGDQFTIQAGTDAAASSQISVNGTSLSSLVSGISSQNISTQAGAQATLEQVNSFISSIANERGKFGATESRLSTAETNVQTNRVEAAAAQARIESADVAEEVANKVSLEILQNSGTAILAQTQKLSAGIVQKLLS